MICDTLKRNNFFDGLTCDNRNRVTYFALSHFKIEGYVAPTYSIKYVIRGTEHYFLNKRRFAVSAGRFLLVNKDQPLDVMIRSQKSTMGFCIHLEPHKLNDVYTQLINTDEQMLDHPFDQLVIPEFEELLYSDKENSLGKYLQQVAKHFNIETDTISLEEDELYYQLARQLLLLQNTIPQGGKKLNVLRSSTKNELSRRLALAKELMDEQKSEPLDVTVIAKEAMLSGSHFFRSFKKLYGTSPYQYLLKRKMEHAAYLLHTKKMSVTETAYQCGFSDLASFSKAFKKLYHQSPKNF